MYKIYRNNEFVEETNEKNYFSIIYSDAIKNYKQYEYRPLEEIQVLYIEYKVYQRCYFVEEQEWKNILVETYKLEDLLDY